MADSTNSLGPDIKGRPFDAEINAAAHKYDLRPALLDGVIEQESHFDPKVTSNAGAQGLAQLMPGTAASLGVTDPYDSVQSINGGAKYLSQLLKTFDGNETVALAAYNAGPHTVQQFGGVPPFKETQDYVNGVEAKAAAFTRGERPEVASMRRRVDAHR